MEEKRPSNLIILKHGLEGLTSSILLATAIENSLFTHIDRGAKTAEEIARAASISLRAAQALLDGLVAIDLLQVAGGKYANSVEASFYLVEDKPDYMGARPKQVIAPWGQAMNLLPEVVRTGVPKSTGVDEDEDHPALEGLVTAIAGVATKAARHVGERIRFAERSGAAVLDVGGGSGAYSATLLGMNPTATATQIDYGPVNRIARKLVERQGLGDRFKTIDGDLHAVDFGEDEYDLGILSNTVCQFSAADNLPMLRRFKRALKPNGMLVISDFVLDDDRNCKNPRVTMQGLFMLVHTKEGRLYTRSEYTAWLKDAGFTSIMIEPTTTIQTFIYAT